MSSTFLPPIPPPPELPERPDGAGGPVTAATGDGSERWRPWSAPLALISALVVALVGGVVVGLAATLFGYPLNRGLPPGALLAATVVQQVAFVASALIFARVAARLAAPQFGLRPTRLWRALGLMAALYLIYAMFTGLWSQLVHVDAGDQLKELGVRGSTFALAVALVVVCVGAPIVEELFFRGFFFRALRNWRGPWPAAVVTGLVFGAMHAGGSPAGALVPLAVLGFALCLLREWTGSLFPCVALHAINNGIAFGVSEGWGAGIVLVVLGALALCAAILVPISRRWRGGASPPPPHASGTDVLAPAPTSA